MIKFISTISACFALCLICSNLSWADEVTIPAELLVNVKQSEKIGSELFEAFTLEQPVKSKNLLKAQLIAENGVNDRCDFSYRSVVLPRQNVQDDIQVYLIGILSDKQNIIAGRHYHVDVSNDGTFVKSIKPSTKSCLIIPNDAEPQGSSAVGAYMTHILSSTPTEFHVFLNLYYDKTLFIGTSMGAWMIEHGKVKYLGNTQ